MTRITVVGAVLISIMIWIALIAIKALTEWSSGNRKKSE
jgi:hypothetical protein